MTEAEQLEGAWKVKRVWGLVPRFGVRKHFGAGRGLTTLLGLPIGRFTLEGRTLQYRFWPVRDELVPAADGTWEGRGYVWGLPYCRFRLVRP